MEKIGLFLKFVCVIVQNISQQYFLSIFQQKS